jgi:hypothetical protein
MMQVYLEVATGTLAGESVCVNQDDGCVVGSGDQCDLPVTDDDTLQAVDFFLDTRNNGVRVFSCGSEIAVNGKTGKESSLSHLDWISAGNTLFRVSFRGFEPPEFPETPTDRLIAYLSESRQQLYALVAESVTIFGDLLIKNCGEMPIPLYPVHEREVAAFEHPISFPRALPWLLPIGGTKSLLDDVVRACWGRDQIVFFTSSQPPASLRRHLLRYVHARIGKVPFAFPFYLPSWMRLFFAETPQAQQLEFLDPFDSFLIEDDTPNGLLEFRKGGGSIVRTSRRLMTHSPIPTQSQLEELLGVRQRTPMNLLELLRQMEGFELASKSEDWLAQLLDDGRRLGLTSQSALVQYVLVVAVAGPEFTRVPEVAAHLSRPEFSRDSLLDLFVLAFNQQKAASI